MILEILIASGIALLAVYLLYKNIKKSAAGRCNGCTSASKENSGCCGCSEIINHK